MIREFKEPEDKPTKKYQLPVADSTWDFLEGKASKAEAIIKNPGLMKPGPFFVVNPIDISQWRKSIEVEVSSSDVAGVMSFFPHLSPVHALALFLWLYVASLT